MMNSMTTVKTIAFLAANGFEEKHLILAQKVMRDAGFRLKVVSTDSGLIGGMAGKTWGHNHMVDESLNTALGVDYAGVIIAGGESSHAKLKKTAHTQRFVNSVMTSGKPVVALSNAYDMMQEMGMVSDGVTMMSDLSEENTAEMMDVFTMQDNIEVAA